MKMENIKPTPKYIVERIKKLYIKKIKKPTKQVRFYSYLTKNDRELVKVTVAVRNNRNDWHYKQVAVHGIDSDKCFVKDMVRFFMGTLAVGWYEEGLSILKVDISGLEGLEATTFLPDLDEVLFWGDIPAYKRTKNGLVCRITDVTGKYATNCGAKMDGKGV